MKKKIEYYEIYMAEEVLTGKKFFGYTSEGYKKVIWKHIYDASRGEIEVLSPLERKIEEYYKIEKEKKMTGMAYVEGDWKKSFKWTIVLHGNFYQDEIIEYRNDFIKENNSILNGYNVYLHV